MKRFLMFFVLVFIATMAFAQTDCRPYVPTQKGTIWEITNYDKKGKETGSTVYQLIDKKEDGANVTFNIKSISYDKKGKELLTTTFEAECVDGKFELDMTYKMEGSTMQAYQNMDMDIDASEYELPSMSEPVGTKLKDGVMNVGIDGGPMTINMNVNIINREVVDKEAITTPAGKFECIVLTQDINTKMMVNIKASSKEWYAENVGMVRSESYNKSGKLTGYSELTKLDRP